MKYLSCSVTFTEIPDSISLCIWVSQCPHRCKGCNMEALQCDLGEELTDDKLDEIITVNGKHADVVVFMGDGADKQEMFDKLKYIRDNHPDKKIGLYSGYDTMDSKLKYKLDFYKVGKYMSGLGGLSFETTNQRMYEKVDGVWNDITFKFQMRKKRILGIDAPKREHIRHLTKEERAKLRDEYIEKSAKYKQSYGE